MGDFRFLIEEGMVTPDELKRRTKQYAPSIMHFSESVPNTRAGNIVANQLVRSGTSVGANYRAVCRARSDPDFVSKLGITLEEADESVYWLEILVESKMKTRQDAAELIKEGNELVAILNTSYHTAKRRLNNQKSKIKNLTR